jgi:hypothetical protein
MGSTPGQPTPMAAAERRRWIWALRATVLLSMAFLCVPFVPSMRYEGPALLLITLPAQLIYLLPLVRLRAKTFKEGLALAFSIAPPSLLLVGIYFALASTDGWIEESWARGYLALFALLQVAMFAGAVTAFKRLPSESGDGKVVRRSITNGAVYLLILLFIVTFPLPASLRARPLVREIAAVDTIKKLNKCTAAYSSNHPERGFPAGLDLMAGCIDMDRASWKSDYEFSYRPGTADTTGRIEGYAVSGRPRRYGRSGVTSFLSDGTGDIRWTKEDRSATPDDPLIEEDQSLPPLGVASESVNRPEPETPSAAVRQFRVTRISLTAEPKEYEGPCPTTVKFSG